MPHRLLLSRMETPIKLDSTKFSSLQINLNTKNVSLTSNITMPYLVQLLMLLKIDFYYIESEIEDYILVYKLKLTIYIWRYRVDIEAV